MLTYLLQGLVLGGTASIQPGPFQAFLLSLVADRLWLVKDGGVAPYAEDLDAYRAMLLGEPDKDKPKAAKPARPKATRDQVLALRAEVRKCEQRVEKLEEMRMRLASGRRVDPRDLWHRPACGQRREELAHARELGA